jgi:tripartite-type tricarboxylate transporter receptor subunit TctC
LAKANPGKLNFSSPGVARTAYIAAALFKQAADIDIVHIPFKSAPDSLTAVLRNDAQLYFAAVNLASEMVRSDKVRAIAMATTERVSQMPKVPTFRESGFDFVYDAWFGLMAPAGVKREILEQINRDTIKVLQSPDIVAKMKQQAAVVIFDDLGGFDKVIRDDTEKMKTIFRSN